jgi:hypothetical protein
VAVVAKDHELDARTLKTSEALAKYRWEQILDPNGPKYPMREYATAVGRAYSTINRFAKGYALYLARQGDRSGAITPLSILDAIELARHGAETQVFTEAIAEGSEEPVQRIAHPGQRQRRAVIIEQARERAERRGTDPVDEARDIAKRQKQTQQMNAKHRQSKASQHTRRWMDLEALLTRAKKALLDAIATSKDVKFDDEEIDLLRDSLENVKAVLNLLDVQLLGTPDVDWDASLARLTGGA